MLSPFSKIFEKCIHHRLTQYLEKKKLLNVNQYGFRPNCSTSHAVSEISDDFFDNLDKEYTTCGLFLDLAKAFDTVDHNILLSKLAKYGIRGLPHQLLKSYLTNRKQYTVVNGKQSSVRNITCGVPQGSTLEPLLFINYKNDLPLASYFRTRLFADDTSLTLSNSNTKQLEKDANTEVKKINDWMCLNKLSINYTKTEFLLITKKRNNVDFNITMNNHKIERKSHVKYLGVIIDDALLREPHIKQVCSKISRGSFAILKLRKYVSKNIFKCVYYALINSHLQYCIASWGQASHNALLPLKLMQKRIIRIMTNRGFRDPSLPLFAKLNILQVDDVIKLEVAKLMHSILGNDKPQFKKLKLSAQIHGYQTRHSTQLNYFLPRKRIETGKKSFQFYGPKIWQEVPSDIKTHSYENFKVKYKRYLLSFYDTQIN